MNLQFDNLTELEEFLMFSAHIGRAFATQAAPDVRVKDEPADSRSIEEFDRAMQGEDGPILATGAAEQTPGEVIEKPKRTRRTKAEIEAERAGNAVAPAEVAQPDTSGTTSVAAAESASTPAGAEPRGNPFAAAPGIQAILDAPDQSAATLAAMAALTHTQREARVEQILAEGTLTDSLAHLKYCQKFIQMHGMSKYNESFVEGLKVNIADYKPEQRALHVALLEELA